MPRRPNKERLRRPVDEPKTIAELLWYASNPRTREQLERFRIEYEAEYGETDLTKRYTSTWPYEEQIWLMHHDLKRYFDGLPPFVKAFVKGKVELTTAEGRLDDLPDKVIQLFMSGQMCLDSDSRQR